MTFRIRTVETTAQGRSIVRDRDFAGARVTIGRAADNTLHLPDLALDPHHAARAEDGGWRRGARHSCFTLTAGKCAAPRLLRKPGPNCGSAVTALPWRRLTARR
jgi:hypothetical protein